MTHEEEIEFEDDTCLLLLRNAQFDTEVEGPIPSQAYCRWKRNVTVATLRHAWIGNAKVSRTWLSEAFGEDVVRSVEDRVSEQLMEYVA